MLHLIQSNRQPALAAALCTALARAPARDVFAPEHLIVPSAALRRRLELDLAGTFGVAANLRFAYLASWLWEQIGKVAPVPEQSPFSPDRLSWRLYRLLDAGAWQAPGHERLARYLGHADAAMRYALAVRIAEVFDHYLTYRPEYLGRWQRGESLFDLQGGNVNASEVNRADERWQSTLWQRVLDDLGDPLGEPVIAQRFLGLAASLDVEAVRAVWPARVSVFAPPTIAPLHAALLREFGRFIDVDLYLLNPCREFWHDIVTERQVGRLEAAGRADYQEVGNPLLAEWGRQTQALLHIVHEMTEANVDAEADVFEANPASTWLASVQNAILELRRWPERAAHADVADDSIEIHIGHSLTRQLEALHDRLLAWFEADASLTPADVLVALPDLPSAAPAIDAVFGGGDGPRIPYRITGLPPSQSNPVARVMLDWLALSDASLGASQLIEWLRVDAIAARYGIDSAALDTLQEWLAAAGARRGLGFDDANPSRGSEIDPLASLNDADDGHSSDADVHSGSAASIARRRHTFADALLRLYLGYALPDDAEPVEDWLPTVGPAGAEAELLGRLSAFVDELDRFAQACGRARDATGWQRLLNEALGRFFDASPAFADDLGDLRDAVDLLARSISEGTRELEIPVEVLRDALASALDDPARGGVPAGSVTFSALTSLRGVPFRVICLLGLDDGVLPNAARAPEFDLLAAFPKLGDRQRRDDDRNLFLDYLLAATDHFVVGYTGRSIRDNAIKPPAAPVDELLDYLGASLAGAAAPPEEIAQARAGFVVEHPLQPYAVEYLRRDGALFTFDPMRAEVAGALLGPREVMQATPQATHATTDAVTDTGSPSRAFFAVALPPPEDEAVSFDALLAFWSQPARALLRDRLGLNFRSARAELDESEPFVLDWDGRDALADRLLPLLVDGEADIARAGRIARAIHELPGGATGAIWRERELNSLARLAITVRAARGDALEAAPYFALDLSACWSEGVRQHGLPLIDAVIADAIDRQALVLDGALPAMTSLGLVVYRHASPTARDYLGAWLHHLVLCTVKPAGVALSTYWIGRGARFTFREDPDARRHLCELVTLYRAGLCAPLPFFPKTSWAWVDKGEGAAMTAWQGGFDRAGEQDDPYVSTAWRGTALRFDARFDALARDVLEPLRAHLGPEQP